MQGDQRNPAHRTHGLTAVPLFHAAWLFAAGIVVASRVWLAAPLVLILLVLVAVLCAVGGPPRRTRATHCWFAAGDFVDPAGRVVRGDGAAACACAKAGRAF